MSTPKTPESLSKGSITQGPDYTDILDAQPTKLYSANIVGVVTTVSNDMLTSSSTQDITQDLSQMVVPNVT